MLSLVYRNMMTIPTQHNFFYTMWFSGLMERGDICLFLVLFGIVTFPPGENSFLNTSLVNSKIF